MKTTAAIALSLGMVTLCSAGQMLVEHDWGELAAAGQLLGGTPVSLDGRRALEIKNTNAAPLLVRIFRIQRPPITANHYAVTGEVKYEGVRGDGYLEMWNCFPPPQAGGAEAGYFSRTLGGSGEMGRLAGSSGWRRFVLPFDRTGTSNPPVRLEINLYLPAQGTVYLGPVKLVQGAQLSGQGAGAWWSERTAGLIGGIGGAAIGCLGGLLGWLASQGRMRLFVLMTMRGLIGLGALAALAGVVALGLRQPYEVWFVLLLFGVLLLGILVPRLWSFERHYATLELRRINSLDAMGG